MYELKISPPSEKQRRFFESRARFVGYGGARGGGKSWAMRTKFVLMCFRYAGLKALLLRKTLPELKENHLIPLIRLLGESVNYKASERTFEFPNGSYLKLGYCDSENDVLQFQGQAYEVIGLEEATHFTEFQFQAISESNSCWSTCKSKVMVWTGVPVSCFSPQPNNKLANKKSTKYFFIFILIIFLVFSKVKKYFITS